VPPGNALTKEQKLARKKVAQTIATLRHKMGWTQEEAAEHIGIHFRHFQKIEYAQINITLDTFIKISKAFKISMSELFISL